MEKTSQRHLAPSKLSDLYPCDLANFSPRMERTINRHLFLDTFQLVKEFVDLLFDDLNRILLNSCCLIIILTEKTEILQHRCQCWNFF